MDIIFLQASSNLFYKRQKFLSFSNAKRVQEPQESLSGIPHQTSHQDQYSQHVGVDFALEILSLCDLSRLASLESTGPGSLFLTTYINGNDGFQCTQFLKSIWLREYNSFFHMISKALHYINHGLVNYYLLNTASDGVPSGDSWSGGPPVVGLVDETRVAWVEVDVLWKI